MKSLNLSLKSRCTRCNSAKARKRIRLDREDNHPEDVNTQEAVSEEGDEEDDEVVVSEDDEQSDDADSGGKKRKKSGENHTHCHCQLFSVPDGLCDFMAGGQPYRRFKADQIKKRASANVDNVILLQKRKQDRIKYKQDLKKEVVRFKNALKLSKAKTPLNPQPRKKTPQELKEERRLRKEEIERKRRAVKESLPLLFD